MRLPKHVTISILLVLISAGLLTAQTTEFTYQGNLSTSGSPATGAYDFEFLLFDEAAAGRQLGSTLARNAVSVTSGAFAVSLDFGDQFPGANRFLEIRVRTTGGGAFTPLAPRQQINSSPYSVRSLNAATSETAINAQNLDPGSANYIQNTTNQQANSNFNISGNGSVGGSVAIGTSNPQGKLHAEGGPGIGVYGTSTGYTGVYGYSPSSGDGVIGFSIDGRGIYGSTNTGWAGFFNGKVHFSDNVGIGTTNPQFKLHVDAPANAIAVHGSSSGLGGGVYGLNTGNGIGVYGVSNSAGGRGVVGESISGTGVKGYSSSGFAGYFDGKVLVYPSSGNGHLGLRNRTNSNFSQLLFADDTDTYRGYVGYIGSNAGLGARNDTLEFGSNARPITFRPNEAEVMRLTTNGRVGIGTALPTSKLFVVGGSLEAVNATSENSTALKGVSTSGTGVSGISSTGDGVYGYSGAGTLSGYYAGSFDGDLYVSNRIRLGMVGTSSSTDNYLCYGNAAPHVLGACTSSLRYKTDVRTFSGGMNVVSRLRPITFNWKLDGTPAIGLAAEEVDEVEPLLAFRDDNGEIAGVKYNRLAAVFINALKEQQAQIARMQRTIGTMQKQINRLRSGGRRHVGRSGKQRRN